MCLFILFCFDCTGSNGSCGSGGGFIFQEIVIKIPVNRFPSFQPIVE